MALWVENDSRDYTQAGSAGFHGRFTQPTAQARDDESCACAVGAMGHLWVVIVAHNHFVPAHEHLWRNVPMLTHAASE